MGILTKNESFLHTPDWLHELRAPLHSEPYYTTQRSPNYRLGARVTITDYALMETRDITELFHWRMKDLQYKVGLALVDKITEAGGVATVSLQFRRDRNHEMCAENLTLYADVNPAEHINYRLIVPHYEDHHIVWPADWYCDFCGTLNDGLKHPRSCKGCQGSKPQKYF